MFDIFQVSGTRVALMVWRGRVASL